MSEFEHDQACTVVINHEEQYSVWPQDTAIPSGWRETGYRGPKDACLAHIKDVWTDMRPLSVRKAMEANNQK
jgi:MbtH protein